MGGTTTTGNLSFTTKHLTTFAASSKQASSGGDSGDTGDGTQAASGGGCSVASVNHNMSIGSAFANTLILIFPSIIFGIRRKRNEKIEKRG